MTGYQLRGAGSASTVTLNAPNISQLSLYINNIFVNPEIHKIFIKRIGFSLIRVHRQQNISTSLASTEILLQNLKWPIETMFVGMRPSLQKNDLAHWHKFTQVSLDTFSMPNLITKASSFTAATSGVATSDGTTTAAHTWPVTATTTVTPTFVGASCVAERHTKTVDRLTITSHGVFLYNDLPADFFHQYTTLTYGGPNVRTPDDEGCYMIPFNLYPGTYQPSGHVNVSRAREFYIKYTSSVIGTVVSGTATAGELVVVASAINFLLISDGLTEQQCSTGPQQANALYVGFDTCRGKHWNESLVRQDIIA